MTQRHAPIPGLPQAIGGAIRSGRRAAGWSQRQFAARLGISQSEVSRLECGLRLRVSLRLIERAFETLAIRPSFAVDGLGLEGRAEQRDMVHARCCGYVGRHLVALGWDVRHEVEIGAGRYRGWIDLLAYRPIDRSAICLEVKTQIDDLGALQRTLNWYQREAWAAARAHGWAPRRLASGVIALATAEVDRRLHGNRDLVRQSFPGDARDLERWLAEPGRPGLGRTIALVDPRSRRRAWLHRPAIDGRRSPTPYADYRAAARALGPGRSGGRAVRRTTEVTHDRIRRCRMRHRQLGE